jgi:glutamate-1-semialdehyde 2,1-aminomutase
LGVPGSAGVPEGLSRDTIVCPYNNIVTFRQVMERHGRDVAAVIVEPVAANMGVVVPHEDFLSELRRITARYGVLLIFDEVITGFRFHFGGAQTLWKIKPDLTCLGKIIGGGLPMGAYGGRRDIMQRVAPLGDVYQAGTLSGNPVAVAAGMATLKVLKQQDYKLLERRTTMLCQGLQGSFQAQGISTTINQCGSLFTVFFSKDPVTDFTSAKKADAKRYAKYFWSMLRRGVYLPPSQFEAQFVSFAHKEVDLRKTCKVC